MNDPLTVVVWGLGFALLFTCIAIAALLAFPPVPV